MLHDAAPARLWHNRNVQWRRDWHAQDAGMLVIDGGDVQGGSIKGQAQQAVIAVGHQTGAAAARRIV